MVKGHHGAGQPASRPLTNPTGPLTSLLQLAWEGLQLLLPHPHPPPALCPACLPSWSAKKLKNLVTGKLRHPSMEMTLSQSLQAPENMGLFLWKSRMSQLLRSAQSPGTGDL